MVLGNGLDKMDEQGLDDVMKIFNAPEEEWYAFSSVHSEPEVLIERTEEVEMHKATKDFKSRLQDILPAAPEDSPDDHHKLSL